MSTLSTVKLSHEHHSLPIVHEFIQVLERISAAERHVTDGDKELLLLANFLSHTEFRVEEPTTDQLNARAAELAGEGFIARNGWLLRRTRQPNMPKPTWSLERMP